MSNLDPMYLTTLDAINAARAQMRSGMRYMPCDTEEIDTATVFMLSCNFLGAEDEAAFKQRPDVYALPSVESTTAISDACADALARFGISRGALSVDVRAALKIIDADF